MTENKALLWVQALHARGVSLEIRNGRLWMRPVKAYAQLSDDELVTMRRYRNDIKTIITSGDYSTPVVRAEAQAEAPTREPQAPPPEPLCAYCGNRKCVGPQHPAYSTLHYMSPSEIAKRNEAATTVMYHQVGRDNRY